MRRASLAGTPFAEMGSHYWNILGDGIEVDFTKAQFQGNYPHFVEYATRTPAYVLNNENTRRRFKELSFNLAKVLEPENPLFQDPIYRAGFDAAMDSPCQKLKVGAVAVAYQLIPTFNENIVATTCNYQNPVTQDWCQPKCIRFDIPSRTESMIGSCDHAEELLLDAVRTKNIPPTQIDIYVVGLDLKNLPLFSSEAEFSCIRCANQMYRADVHSVAMPVTDKGWVHVSAEEALITSKQYALRVKEA